MLAVFGLQPVSVILRKELFLLPRNYFEIFNLAVQIPRNFPYHALVEKMENDYFSDRQFETGQWSNFALVRYSSLSFFKSRFSIQKIQFSDSIVDFEVDCNFPYHALVLKTWKSSKRFWIMFNFKVNSATSFPASNTSLTNTKKMIFHSKNRIFRYFLDCNDTWEFSIPCSCKKKPKNQQKKQKLEWTIDDIISQSETSRMGMAAITWWRTGNSRPPLLQLAFVRL